ncbi:MAG: hypothetical protein Q9211_003219 [Gyalolechia sp. 1 TL-2023]
MGEISSGIRSSTQFIWSPSTRLESQHQVLSLVFDGRLFFPPVQTVGSVLDCGYGAASWAVEVAETYPDCTVIGVDISPHMKPDDLPENFIAQLDDINRPFTFDANSFDFVNSRLIGGGINRARWPGYLRDIKKQRWSREYFRSIEGVKDPRAALQLHALLTSAGFTEIQTNMIPLPLCAWGTDDKQRRIGEANKENIRQLLSTLAIFPFTRRLGMSINAVNDLVDRAREDAANPGLKPYFPLTSQGMSRSPRKDGTMVVRSRPCLESSQVSRQDIQKADIPEGNR